MVRDRPGLMYREESCSGRDLVLFGLLLAVYVFSGAVSAQQPGPVVVVEMSRDAPLIEEVQVTGTVISQRVAQLSTEVSGLVQSINVDIGDSVSSGDEIAHLDDELITLSLAAANAETEQAIREMEDAKRRLKVAMSLEKSRAVSTNEMDSLAAEVNIDGAVVARYQAIQKRQEAQKRRHSLTAPFSGIISRKLVEEGEWVQPGQAVVELVATNDLLIEFRVPQSAYVNLDEESELDVTLDALPGKKIPGSIETIIPVADRASRTFPVRVALDDPGIDVAPGMSASANLKLNKGELGVVVSRDALIRYPDGRVIVWVVEQDGESSKVSERQVKTGEGFEGMVSIKDGLTGNTMVVIKGNEALRDGQQVTIQE